MSGRKIDLESVILEAARRNDDCLDSLLQKASKIMDEEQYSRLLDRVEQIVHEGSRDACEWKDNEEKE